MLIEGFLFHPEVHHGLLQEATPGAFKAKVALEAAKRTRTCCRTRQGVPSPLGADQQVERSISSTRPSPSSATFPASFP